MEVFDSLEQHIQNPLVLQSILSLMEQGTLVLTTNYDNLLEIFGQQQSKPMESLDLKDKSKVRVGGWAGGRRACSPQLCRWRPGRRQLPAWAFCCRLVPCAHAVLQSALIRAAHGRECGW